MRSTGDLETEERLWLMFADGGRMELGGPCWTREMKEREE